VNNRNKIIIFVLLATLFIGVLIGLLIGEIPFTDLEVAQKVRVENIFSIFFTVAAILVAAFITPLITKKLIEDNRVLKDLLLEDLNEFLKAVNDIHDQFQEYAKRGQIIEEEEHQLFRMFDKSDRNIHSLTALIEHNCSPKTLELVTELQNRYFAYWEFITGDEILQITEEISNKEIDLINSISFAATDLKSNIVGL